MEYNLIPYRCLAYHYSETDEEFPDWVKQFNPIRRITNQNLIYIHDHRNPDRKEQHTLSEGRVLVYNIGLSELRVISKSEFEKRYE